MRILIYLLTLILINYSAVGQTKKVAAKTKAPSTIVKDLPKFLFSIDSTDIIYMRNLNIRIHSDSILSYYYEDLYYNRSLPNEWFILEGFDLGFDDMKGWTNGSGYKRNQIPKYISGCVDFETPEHFVTQFPFTIRFFDQGILIYIHRIREYYNKDLGSPTLVELKRMVDTRKERDNHPDVYERVLDYDKRAKLVLDGLTQFILLKGQPKASN